MEFLVVSKVELFSCMFAWSTSGYQITSSFISQCLVI